VPILFDTGALELLRRRHRRAEKLAMDYFPPMMCPAVMRGRAQIAGQPYETYAVVEVSVTLAAQDVERAARRAALLRKKGWKVIAVAAGEEADPRLIQQAAQSGVAVLEDGRALNCEQALAAA
jgi:hypothetical protein